MRKIYFILFLFIGFATTVRSQQCQTGTALINPSIDSLAMFTPSSDSLPCIVRQKPVSDTLYFTTFKRLQGFTIDSLTIDSIGNLPGGLCWSTNSPTNTFAGGQNGVLYLSGQTYASAGQYKMAIYVKGNTNVFPIPFSSLETLIGFRYYLRVACPGSPCPAIDTTAGKTSAYVPYNTQACGVGVNEISSNLSNVSIVPNPFTSTATVSVSSNVEGTFTIKMTNLLGAVVSTKEMQVVHGHNEISIERNGLVSGIYMMSLANGNGSISKKVVIE